MQYIRQLICLIGFLMLAATSCMAQIIVNQGEVDDSLHQVVKRSTSDCINATIYPTACGTDCTLSFHRYGSNLGITFLSRSSITGFNAITGISGASTITFTASTTTSGTIVTYARIAGLGGAFYSVSKVAGSTSTINGTSATIPIFPVGAPITAITTINFTTRKKCYYCCSC